MSNFLLAFGIFSSIFILLWICTILGNLFGRKHQAKGIQNKGITKIAEGTVFALLGLLIAFCFSGAYDRFEHRKLYIIDDINAIETASIQIDLMNPSYQDNLKLLLYKYVEAKINLYRKLNFFNDALGEVDQFNQAKDNLWRNAIAATKVSSNSANLLFLSALDKMFDLAGTRLNILKVHPPVVVFTLLIWLAMLSCFLIGYSLAGEKYYSKVFLFSYVAVISFTLYIIIDLEMPRVGLIRVVAFDKLLLEEENSLLQKLKKN